MNNTRCGTSAHQVIIDDEEIGVVDVVELAEGRNGLARVVHEGHGLDEDDLDGTNATLGHLCVLLERGAEGKGVSSRQEVEEREPDVVTRAVVLAAGVAQTDDHPLLRERHRRGRRRGRSRLRAIRDGGVGGRREPGWGGDCSRWGKNSGHRGASWGIVGRRERTVGRSEVEGGEASGETSRLRFAGRRVGALVKGGEAARRAWERVTTDIDLMVIRDMFMCCENLNE